MFEDLWVVYILVYGIGNEVIIIFVKKCVNMLGWKW